MSLQGEAIAPLETLAAWMDPEPVVKRSDLIRPITPIDRIELPRETSQQCRERRGLVCSNVAACQPALSIVAIAISE